MTILHPLRKQLIARGMRVVVLSSSAIMYLANLPLRLAVVSIVSSCFSSLRALSDGLISFTSATLITESLGVGWMASSGIGDMYGLPLLLLGLCPCCDLIVEFEAGSGASR